MVWDIMDGHNKKGIEASDKNMVIWVLWYLFWEDFHIMYNSKKLHCPGRWHS